MSIITGCPNLKSLSLHAFRYPVIGIPAPFPHLESLILSDAGDFLVPLALNFYNPSSLPRLRHIDFSMEFWYPLSDRLPEVLKEIPLLQSIRFKFKVDCYDARSPSPRFPLDFDISLLTALRSFRLELHYPERNDHGILISKSFHIFNKLSGRCSIHEISMEWTLRIDPNDITDSICSSNEYWRSFDEVITSSRFSSLTKLLLRFNLEYTKDTDISFDRISAILSSAVRRCLPAVSNSDSLSFVVEIQSLHWRK